MIRKDPPIEINAHGEGWNDVSYVRADIAKKRVDDCESESMALREYAEANAAEANKLRQEIEQMNKRHEKLRQKLFWVSDKLLHSLGGNILSNEDALKIIEFAKEYGVNRE